MSTQTLSCPRSQQLRVDIVMSAKSMAKSSQCPYTQSMTMPTLCVCVVKWNDLDILTVWQSRQIILDPLRLTRPILKCFRSRKCSIRKATQKGHLFLTNCPHPFFPFLLHCRVQKNLNHFLTREFLCMISLCSYFKKYIFKVKY